MKAKNPPDAMKCAECDRPLLWQGAVCGHCEAKFAQELAEENYRRLLAVQAGEQGQHTCPFCSLCFDQPNTAPTLPTGLPWHLRWNAQGCPHCNTLLEWQPSLRINYFMKLLPSIYATQGVVWGHLIREYLYHASIWQWIALLHLIALWLLGSMGNKPDKGCWVKQTQFNTTKWLATIFAVVLGVTAFAYLFLSDKQSFAGFLWFPGMLAFIAIVTATNLILWKRDYVHRRSVSPSPSS
jgi:hypothetical protein